MERKQKNGLEKYPLKMTRKDWIMSYEEEKIPHWAESFEPSPLAERLLRKMPHPEGNSILEIGVGNGRDSIFLAKEGNEVTGIDVAKRAIELAEKNARKEGVKVNFKIGDAEKLEFENDAFDAVFSISVLHSTNLFKSLKEIARVLKPGGRGMLHLYSKVRSGGRDYHLILWSREKDLISAEEKVRNILEENNLIVEDIYTNIDDRHEEVTEIVVAEFYKKKKPE
jgi:ubiquinone/menaquinone biosynthesis C-methylase UbiE